MTINIYRTIRNVVSNNRLLYKMWFYTYRIRKGDPVRLPTKNDDYYLDGYPRSGNTFISGLLKRVFPDKKFASHLHVPATLRMAVLNKLPTFIMLRSPDDAVISNLYRKISVKDLSPTSENMDMLLSQYILYYTTVLEFIEQVHIIDFSIFIKDNKIILKNISDIINCDIGSDKKIDEEIASFKKLMKEKEKVKKKHAGSLPNTHRIEFKEEYLGKLRSRPSFRKAENLYQDLIQFKLV